jgi:hypothetical protein
VQNHIHKYHHCLTYKRHFLITYVRKYGVCLILAIIDPLAGTGSAAERVVSTSSLFKEITDAAGSLEHKQYLTGGNAALMANR